MLNTRMRTSRLIKRRLPCFRIELEAISATTSTSNVKVNSGNINNNADVSKNNSSRWSKKEFERLQIALKFAINPTSDADWQFIANTVNVIGQQRRSGEECRARAIREGLLRKLKDDEPSDNDADEEYSVAPSSSKLKSSGLLTAPNKKRPAPSHWNYQKGIVNLKEIKKNSDHDEKFHDVHRKSYDSFFAKQELPELDQLEPDDTLFRDYFGQIDATSYVKRTRRPFMISPAVHTPTDALSSGDEDNNS